MKTAPHVAFSLRTALLAAGLLIATGSAFAQVGRYDPAEREARKQKAGDEAQQEKFPEATRTSPKLQATKAGAKALNEIVELYKNKQYPEAIQKAEALASTSKNAYEQGFAYQLAATAAVDAGDLERAAADYKKALDSNGLGNDEHYQVMYNLAVTQMQTKHPADALATVDRLTTETKVTTPESLSLKAHLLNDLNRPQEAAALYEQELARDPNNGKALINAAAAYAQANDFAKANALLATAQKQGLLTDASQYRALYVGYINDNKSKEALAVIDEGIAKGIVQPSPDLAQVYSVLAQNAYAAGDVETAIAMYKRAAPIAADGEASLNLARVLFNEQRLPESRQAAQQALEKGVKNTAEARKLAGGKDK